MFSLAQIEEKLESDEVWSRLFVEIKSNTLLETQIVYATSNNFMNENMYCEFEKAWLHRQAALKLAQASRQLEIDLPGYKLLIYDALRPWRFQVKMFARVAGGPLESYVAHPNRGSLHNYGLAIDLTLKDAEGRIVDMGSGFDEFSEASQPQLEAELFEKGLLTEKQLQNRRNLRRLMEKAGFSSIANEWWHFNSCTLEEAKEISIRID